MLVLHTYLGDSELPSLVATSSRRVFERTGGKGEVEALLCACMWVGMHL